MGEREEEDLYRKFSRKDLQGLCKKYDLPANKSNSEMATSLILYLEKKNISSIAIWEATRSDPCRSGLSVLPAGVSMKSVGNQSKGCRDMESNKGCADRYASQKRIQKDKGPVTPDQASDDIHILTRLQRDRKSGSGVPENTFSSVVSSTSGAARPSFTFDVASEDGIQLLVDLNSNPSDWIESMKAGVRMCSEVHSLEENESHQEVGQTCSSRQKEPNDCQHKDVSNLVIEMAGVARQADEPVGREVRSSPQLKSFSYTVHNVEDFGGEQALLSSRLEHDIDVQNPGPGSVTRVEKDMAIDREKLIATQIETSNFSGISLPNDNIYTESQDRGLKPGDGLYKTPCLQPTCGLPYSVKHNKLLEAASSEIQASNHAFVQHQDVGSSSLRTGTRLDSAGQSRNAELAHLGFFKSMVYHDVHQIQPVQANNQNQYASSSLFMGRRDNLGHNVGIEGGRVSIFGKSNGQIPEAQTQLDDSCKKTMSLFPFPGSATLDFMNLTNGFASESVGIMRSQRAAHEAVELHKKDVYLNPCSSSRSLDLAAPKRSGLDRYMLNYSNDLDKDKCWSQTRTDGLLDMVNIPTSVETENVKFVSSHKAGQEAVELKKDALLSCRPLDLAFPMQNGVNHYHLNYSNNLDKGICRKTGNVMESSEFSDFSNSMEKPWRKAAYSESNGEFKKQRHFSTAENESQSVSPEANISSTSKHLKGDASESRRRSSRLGTKWIVDGSIGDGHDTL